MRAANMDFKKLKMPRLILCKTENIWLLPRLSYLNFAAEHVLDVFQGSGDVNFDKQLIFSKSQRNCWSATIAAKHLQQTSYLVWKTWRWKHTLDDDVFDFDDTSNLVKSESKCESKSKSKCANVLEQTKSSRSVVTSLQPKFLVATPPRRTR